MEIASEGPIRLALVDDDPTVLFTLSQLLTARGFDIAMFREANGLLEQLAKGAAFECIVADVRMPSLSGLDLQHRLGGACRRARTTSNASNVHGDSLCG